MSTKDSLYAQHPLNSTRNDIRVFHLQPGTWGQEICGTVSVSNLNDAAYKYACLSYVWGDEAVTKPIKVHGLEFQATTNLADCLHHLRDETETILIWIDAICINQNSLSEKSHQVGMMDKIYSLCSRVYVWLGSTPDPTAARLDPFALLQHFADDRHFLDLPGFSRDSEGTLSVEGNDRLSALWAGFLLVAESAWWTRAWTVQEIILPSRSVIIHGTWRSSLKMLILSRKRRNHHMITCCLSADHLLPDKGIFNVFYQQIRWIERYREEHLAAINLLGSEHDRLFQRFYEIAQAFAGRQCKNPRDKVYSLLAMARGAAFQNYRPDYSIAVSECYTGIFRCMLEECAFDFRCMLGVAFGNRVSGMPSWVPDFSQNFTNDTANQQLRRLLAYSLFDASAKKPNSLTLHPNDELHARGVKVDTISSLGLSSKSGPITLRNGKAFFKRPY